MQVVGLRRRRVGILFRLELRGRCGHAGGDVVDEPVVAGMERQFRAIGGKLRCCFVGGRTRHLSHAAAGEIAQEDVAVAHERRAHVRIVEHQLPAVGACHGCGVDDAVLAVRQFDAMQVVNRRAGALDAVVHRTAVDTEIRRRAAVLERLRQVDLGGDPVRIGHDLFERQRRILRLRRSEYGQGDGAGKQALHGDSDGIGASRAA